MLEGRRELGMKRMKPTRKLAWKRRRRKRRRRRRKKRKTGGKEERER
jgi:hypothetical protein